MPDFIAKLVCFDLNKTLIRENTWYELNLAMGVTPREDEQFLKWYDSGEITYKEGQKLLERLYKERGKATRVKMLEAINKYSYREGAREIIDYLRAKGYQIALISGSIDLVVEKVASDLKIDLYGAHNQLVFDREGFFTGIRYQGDDADFKQKLLMDFSTRLKIPLDAMACVGDGFNDRKIFKLTGHGITFYGSEIENLAWKKINRLLDLKAIL